VLPGFAYHFGIRPWEIDDLTYGEARLFVRALNEIAAAASKSRR